MLKKTNPIATVLILILAAALLVGVAFLLTKGSQPICSLRLAELKQEIPEGSKLWANKGNLLMVDEETETTYLASFDSKLEENSFSVVDLELCIFRVGNEPYNAQRKGTLIAGLKTYGFKLQDMTGDGVRDFLVPWAVGYSGVNIYYSLFVVSDAGVLEVLGFENIANPEYKEGSIVSSEKIGFGSEVYGVYKIDGSKVAKLSERTVQINPM